MLNPSCQYQACLSISVSLESLQDGEVGIKNHTDSRSMSKLRFSLSVQQSDTQGSSTSTFQASVTSPTFSGFAYIAAGHVKDYTEHGMRWLFTMLDVSHKLYSRVRMWPIFACQSGEGANVTLESH